MRNIILITASSLRRLYFCVSPTICNFTTENKSTKRILSSAAQTETTRCGRTLCDETLRAGAPPPPAARRRRILRVFDIFSWETRGHLIVIANLANRYDKPLTRALPSKLSLRGPRPAGEGAI
ncbi:hypothetical protein EVAR_82308_1 [Eumeta japonica]|uniref:Uncharacterized protein n=1 Tax=Eumeta variegata TaxID=151549 RepID=A0A4C1W1E0_EUMVA|nr:hypothetical protein EVAR_82308_1 [Eumeta japonica]